MGAQITRYIAHLVNLVDSRHILLNSYFLTGLSLSLTLPPTPTNSISLSLDHPLFCCPLLPANARPYYNNVHYVRSGGAMHMHSSSLILPAELEGFVFIYLT